MIIVSACLAGIPCNYNGEATPNEKVISLIKEGLAFPVCPEVLGGLTIPRSRTRIVEGDGNTVLDRKKGLLVTTDGKDVTKQFLEGAELTLKVLRLLGIETVILKQDSPSCGCGRTLGGLLEPAKIKGDGVATAILKREGIRVYPEESLADDKLFESLKTEHSKNKKESVLISMCGLGIPCQYRARSFSRKDFIAKLKEKYTLCPLCPEQFGGMPTPRVACRLERGRIIGKDGKDYTQPYQLGSSIVLSFAKIAGIKRAYMKKGSPSCGVGGITRKILEEEGITVHIL
jgi:uncharacterized protein YbbK (DUF523 family)